MTSGEVCATCVYDKRGNSKGGVKLKTHLVWEIRVLVARARWGHERVGSGAGGCAGGGGLVCCGGGCSALSVGTNTGGSRYGIWANDMGDDSIDMVILRIDMGYVVTLLPGPASEATPRPSSAPRFSQFLHRVDQSSAGQSRVLKPFKLVTKAPKIPVMSLGVRHHQTVPV